MQHTVHDTGTADSGKAAAHGTGGQDRWGIAGTPSIVDGGSAAVH